MTHTSDATLSACRLAHRNVIRPDSSNRIYWTKVLIQRSYDRTWRGVYGTEPTSFADDVAATKRALGLQKGPVILVGHSWVGVVITEAGVDRPDCSRQG
jgi:pimeloyl-ACP methyl ester carboxylesterase